MKKLFSLLIFITLFSCGDAQEKFTIKSKRSKDFSVFQVLDEKGNLIKELDTSKYIICFDEDKLGYFSIFGIANESGWIAIDSQEKQLFKVYNTSYGEPSPDYLIDGKIRIVDEDGKIGFANNKGEVIIKPQFEDVSSFHKGKAIIGKTCKKVQWKLQEEFNHNDCQHYTIECKEYGYIDDKGKIMLIGNYTFEEIAKKINWKSQYE